VTEGSNSTGSTNTSNSGCMKYVGWLLVAACIYLLVAGCNSLTGPSAGECLDQWGAGGSGGGCPSFQDFLDHDN
jgi:hypothetical protein